MEIYIGLLVIFCLLLLGIVFNLFRQIETYEQILGKYEDFMSGISQLIDTSNKAIEQVDINGHYSSDDEVGEFFTTLKGIQSALNEFSVTNIGSEDLTTTTPNERQA